MRTGFDARSGQSSTHDTEPLHAEPARDPRTARHPFTSTGEVAAEALEALAHEVLGAGATGIVALGTTSEAAALDEGERDLVTDVCARVCRERGRC